MHEGCEHACRAKGASSGGHSSCDPVQQLVSAHVSDPEPEPMSPVPGASALSGSSLDIGRLPGPLLATDRSSTVDGSTLQTDAEPSTEVSGMSVICAGGGDHASSAKQLVTTPPAARAPLQPLTAEERAQRCLSECRQDVEDEHLEVEGIMELDPHAPRGPVFWGSWRALEVAINSFVFKVCVHIDTCLICVVLIVMPA